jgi:hypothetical protein
LLLLLLLVLLVKKRSRGRKVFDVPDGAYRFSLLLLLLLHILRQKEEEEEEEKKGFLCLAGLYPRKKKCLFIIQLFWLRQQQHTLVYLFLQFFQPAAVALAFVAHSPPPKALVGPPTQPTHSLPSGMSRLGPATASASDPRHGSVDAEKCWWKHTFFNYFPSPSKSSPIYLFGSNKREKRHFFGFDRLVV